MQKRLIDMQNHRHDVLHLLALACRSRPCQKSCHGARMEPACQLHTLPASAVRSRSVALVTPDGACDTSVARNELLATPPVLAFALVRDMQQGTASGSDSLVSRRTARKTSSYYKR